MMILKDGSGKSFDRRARDHRKADSSRGEACPGESSYDHPGDHGDHVFSGRKFGGQNLRKDDAEAADGASGLWPGAEEERDGEHVEEPGEDPRLCEERRDVVRLLQEKTTHVKWPGDGTKPRKNFVI